MIRKEGKLHRLINHMIQLQELNAALDQQKATQPKTRLKTLADSIKGMADDLPVEYKATFSRQMQKSGLAIAPISLTNCSACTMALPASLVNNVKVADQLFQCPACARFIYWPEGAPRGGSPKRRRSEGQLAGFARFSTTNLMIPKLKGSSPEDVIQQIAAAFEEEGFVDNGQRLAEEALKREAVFSTGVGHGIAFPHVRGVEGGGLSLAVGIHRKGVKFGGPGRSNTRIFFFMTIPITASMFYLKLLAGLTQVFEVKENQAALLEAKTPEEMWKVMNHLTRKVIQ